jgi:two-component system, NtrC family, response regulator PilR
MQVKLLRAIQEKKVRKIGATTEEPVDVRIISATHRNLGDEVKNGHFRQDLYYRLNVIELRMPSLREMREDIPLLATAILKRQSGKTEPPKLHDDARTELTRYDFPGNVRELENILERALALSGSSEIRSEDLRLAPVPQESEESNGAAGESLPAYLDGIERKAILEALGKTGFNRTAAAKLLGITFRQLRYRMQRLGITDESR